LKLSKSRQPPSTLATMGVRIISRTRGRGECDTSRHLVTSLCFKFGSKI
jgi:hypothetical protein